LESSIFSRLVPLRIVLITAIVAAVIMGDSMLYNVLPAQTAAFGISVASVGILLSANRIVRLISNSVAPFIIQRFGIYIPLYICVVVSIGTTITYGSTDIFLVLLISRLMWGICYSIFRLVGFITVLENSYDDIRGRCMGVLDGGGRSGGVIGVLFGGLLFDLYGRGTSFFVIGMLGALGLPLVYLLSRTVSNLETMEGTQSQEPMRSNETNNELYGLEQRSWHVKFVEILIAYTPELNKWDQFKILVCNTTYFTYHMVMNGVLVSTIGLFMFQRLGEGWLFIGIFFGIATVNGMILGLRWISGLSAPFLGYIGDKVGREKILIVSTPLCIISLLLLALPIPTWISIIWLPLAFLATIAASTSLDAMVGGLAPVNRRANVMSRYATWQDLGSAIGPIVAFSILTFTSLSTIYFLGASLLSVAIIMLVLVNRIAEPSHRGLRRD